MLNIKSNCKRVTYEVSPSPANNIMSIRGLQKDDKVFVQDMLDGMLFTFYPAQNSNQINIKQLAAGLSHLRKIDTGFIKANLKFIKS